ncbi:MAG TPA: FG-GAP-like repeat-containing protein [Polyangia bacterium]|nr:FG-GAP-like repeat-containing protein [Polyangia bacterium]
MGSLALFCLLAPAHAAWPPPTNDTGFDYSDPSNWPNDPGYSGDWQFWSFVPNVIKAQVDDATRRLGTGAHYDRAWAKTTGDPRVLIAYTDSGIEWSEGELVNKVFLNAGELKAPVGCPGADGVKFDVNGDGRFNVQDYTTVTGHALPDFAKVCDARITKDVNANGVLDAEDLINAFSDGKDDDGNGYIDDISGWDFFHNDNDPADDTHFGHGTGSSRDGAAETNNSMGGAGVCPDCTMVMLRMGDAFVPEDSKWGAAVAYAVDLGASVIDISGGGGLSNTPFSRDAIDYAYKNNVTIIASNSDLDSFHHNYPNTNDHIISVHAITYDMGNYESSTTFFNYETCTNYGAQLMLSIPATGCSSEAAGRSGGLAGLLYSAALKAGLPAPSGKAGDNRRLTAEQVRQLLITTVDSFYNPADATNPLKYPTKPGFARRFGYGRPNARSAVDAILAGALPPEVDIRTPAWFDTIYNDKVQSVPIVGHVGLPVGVPGAGLTYDYVLEWAPGVDPDDSAFQTIAHAEMQTQAVDGPLGTWDVSNVTVNNPVPALTDPSWQPDDASNVHVVTLRLRATLHSSNPIWNGIKADARRAVHVYKDPDLLPGFPMFVGASGEGSAHLADLLGDGKREIVYGETSGRVHAIRADGTELPGWPVKVELLPLLDPMSHQGKGHAAAVAYTTGGLAPDVHAPLGGTIAVGDIDGDGKPEVVGGTWQGYIWAWHADGSVVNGFPVELDRDTAQVALDSGHELEDGFWASPVLADLTGDKTYEIIAAGMDAKVYVWKGDGSRLDGFPVVVQDLSFPEAMRQRERIMTTPAVGDLNGDGVPDIVVSTNENYNDTGRMYAIDGHGAKAAGGPFLPGWPISVVSTRFLPVVAQGLPNSPAMGDTNGDKIPEILQSGLASTLRVYDAHGKPSGPALANNSSKYGAKSNAKNMVEFMMVSNPAVGDLDDDGTLDLLEGGAGSDVALAFATGGQRHDFEHHMGAWDSKTGRYKNGFPQVIEDWQFFSQPALADVDGDGKIDVIAGSAGYFVHGWNVDGVEAKGFPKFTGGWIISTPAIGDLDGDGKLEVVVSTRNGWLYAWHVAGSSKGRIDWAGFHHDNQNTGNFGTKLDEGRGASPGGCSMAGGENPPPVGVIAVAALALASIYAKRRKQRG